MKDFSLTKTFPIKIFDNWLRRRDRRKRKKQIIEMIKKEKEKRK